jgi:hypothetical protein
MARYIADLDQGYVVVIEGEQYGPFDTLEEAENFVPENDK